MTDEPKYRKPAAIVRDFRAICRANGYALAEHGTKRRDLDLIAVPWTPSAILSGALMKNLANVEGVIYSADASGKPHGRIAGTYMIRITKPGDPRYIDLSVTPRQGDW
jgi:hypothetical protein